MQSLEASGYRSISDGGRRLFRCVPGTQVWRTHGAPGPGARSACDAGSVGLCGCGTGRLAPCSAGMWQTRAWLLSVAVWARLRVCCAGRSRRTRPWRWIGRPRQASSRRGEGKPALCHKLRVAMTQCHMSHCAARRGSSLCWPCCAPGLPSSCGPRLPLICHWGWPWCASRLLLVCHCTAPGVPLPSPSCVPAPVLQLLEAVPYGAPG